MGGEGGSVREKMEKDALPERMGGGGGLTRPILILGSKEEGLYVINKCECVRSTRRRMGGDMKGMKYYR
jgi:hypothetical protein